MLLIAIVLALLNLSDDERFVLRLRACDYMTRVLPDGTVVVKWSCPAALK